MALDIEELNKQQLRAKNPENFNPIFQGHAVRPPLRFIYIFSTAKRDFGPVQHSLFPKITLRGCHNGERYVLAAKIGDPIPVTLPDLTGDETRVYEHDAWKAAWDLINPGFDAMNCNLWVRGIFASVNEVPTEKELKEVEAARDKRYRDLTQKAFRLEATSPRELQEFLMEDPDVHYAMDALGLEAAWHKKQLVLATCPNCGDQVKPNVAFHQSSTGILCIIDPEKALKAGAINKARFKELTELSA